MELRKFGKLTDTAAIPVDEETKKRIAALKNAGYKFNDEARLAILKILDAHSSKLEEIEATAHTPLDL